MNHDPQLDADKSQMRREINAARRALDAGERAVASERACRHLFSLRGFPGTGVALYAALDDEVDTRSLFDSLRRRAIECWFPRCSPGDTLSFGAVAAWNDLAIGRFGVLQPPLDLVRPLSGVSWAVVPGVAFDATGARLGRGRGFYDRTFGDPAASPALVGLGFEVQWVERVPVGATDRRMNAVVTERGVRYALAGESTP